MEHDEAIRTQAAERYVAGELAFQEQDAFEEHFFDCPECAEEVRWEQIFAANARAVSREQPVAAHHPGIWETWRAWFRLRPAFALSLAANAVLAMGFGYVFVNAARNGSAGPRFLPSYWAPPASRAEEQAHLISAGASSFMVHFPAPGQKYPSYSCEILDAVGNREWAGSAKAIAAEEGDLYLEVPLRHLPPGVHTLVVRGSGETVSQSQFRTSR
jgi:hypothetical protein